MAKARFQWPVFGGPLPPELASRPAISRGGMNVIQIRQEEARTLSGIPETEPTFAGRKRKLLSPEQWRRAKPVTRGGIMEIAGMQVMRDDEHEYMGHLTRIAGRVNGRTLEVGYGMGIATRMFLKRKGVTHTIIELNHEIAQRARRELAKEIASGRVEILEGDWKTEARKLVAQGRKFDGILFDTFPLKRRGEELHANHFPFFRFANKLLSENGVFTYYSDEPGFFRPKHLNALLAAGFRGTTGYSIPVNFGAGNDYWQHDTMFVPIITHHPANPVVGQITRDVYRGQLRKNAAMGMSRYAALQAQIKALEAARRPNPKQIARTREEMETCRQLFVGGALQTRRSKALRNADMWFFHMGH